MADSDTMDPVISQFLRKTPVHLLDKYRRHVRKSLDTIFKTLANALLGLPAQGNVEWHEDFLIVTGSTAEGAALARLFSPDSSKSREFECDVMYTLVLLKVEEELLHYVQNNTVFAHIKVDSSLLSQVVSVHSEDVDVAQSLLCSKEDGLYLNSTYAVSWAKKGMELMPDMLNNPLFRMSVTEKTCEVGKASLEITITEPEDKPPESELCARANEQHLRITQESIQHHERFEANIEEMLNRLQTLEKEFAEMSSGNSPASLHDRVAKALEWVMICMDATDLIFDFREKTMCRYSYESLGLRLTGNNDYTRTLLKSEFQKYIDQLVITDDDIFEPSVAETVRGVLSDIECSASRYFATLRTYATQNTTYVNWLNFGNQNPQLSQIPQSLQDVSRFIHTASMDIVPCLKLMFWPSVASEWKTRDRAWPAQSVIDEIVSKGVHLVGKAFCHDDIDWRLSFSVAEIDLATRWSPAQHFVYFIFKSLFYKFIKPLSSDASTADVSPSKSSKTYLASYTAKTVMMWTSESDDQSWWTEDNAAECLTVLLLALQSAFECRTLDHYFVSSVNLLEGLTDVLASRVIDAIKSILADPAAIVDQLESLFEGTDVFFNAMPEQAKGVEMLSSLMNLTRYSYGSQSSPIQILFM